MKVAKKYWPALLAVTLLAAAPSVVTAEEADDVPVEDTATESDSEVDGDEIADEEATDEEAEIVDDESDDAVADEEPEVADDESDDAVADEEPEVADDESDDAVADEEPEVADDESDDAVADEEPEVADDESDDAVADEEPEVADDEDEVAESDASDVDDDDLEAVPEDARPLEEPTAAADDPIPAELEDEDDDPRREPIDEVEYEPGAGGIATVHADPATDVQVLGNLEEGDRWSLAIGGYMRTAYTWIQADPDHQLFGRNDGFQILDARLITRAEMDNGLGAIFSLDAGSRLTRTEPDSPVEELAMRMADAYVYYSPIDYLEFNAGQFKAPFDAEDLISSSDLLFVHRSVANRGVQDVEGFNVQGLSQSRQIGIQARGTYPLGDDEDDDVPAISYAVAAANGNGPNRSMNENDRLAYYGRTAFHWGDLVSIGGAAFLNDRTFGDPPDQVDRETWGWTADVQANLYDFSLLANVISETRSVPEIEQDPETTGLGYQVQLAYEEPSIGIQPAYRFAYYDPTFRHGGDEEDDFFEHDAQFHHTLGVNYNARDYPLRLMANYTFVLQEEEGRPLDNDRLDLLLQLQW